MSCWRCLSFSSFLSVLCFSPEHLMCLKCVTLRHFLSSVALWRHFGHAKTALMKRQEALSPVIAGGGLPVFMRTNSFGTVNFNVNHRSVKYRKHYFPLEPQCFQAFFYALHCCFRMFSSCFRNYFTTFRFLCQPHLCDTYLSPGDASVSKMLLMQPQGKIWSLIFHWNYVLFGPKVSQADLSASWLISLLYYFSCSWSSFWSKYALTAFSITNVLGMPVSSLYASRRSASSRSI